MKNKFISALLAGCLAVGCIGPVSAEEIATADRTEAVPVELAAEALTFSVTVPTSLPINVTANGEVSVSEEAKIINNSAGAVEVKNVVVEASNGWTLDYWDADLSVEKVNTKKFAMSINNTNVDDDGGGVGDCGIISANSYMDFPYDAHIAPQSNSITETIANVVITIGWDEVKQ